MARILTNEGESAPAIDESAVAAFFEQRAHMAKALGPLRAVLYQDKHPDLAERRDRVERETLLPWLALSATCRVLDVGCGTGRWARTIRESGAIYHGADLSEGLVSIARSLHGDDGSARFTACPADELSLSRLGESEPFDRILCSGILIYMNDAVVLDVLDRLAKISAPNTRIVVREPMGCNKRLTLDSHYSDEMEQDYHAIYRTDGELLHACRSSLESVGFQLIESRDLYEDATLNNRVETRQRFMVWERNA